MGIKLRMNVDALENSWLLAWEFAVRGESTCNHQTTTTMTHFMPDYDWKFDRKDADHIFVPTHVDQDSGENMHEPVVEVFGVDWKDGAMMWTRVKSVMRSRMALNHLVNVIVATHVRRHKTTGTVHHLVNGAEHIKHL